MANPAKYGSPGWYIFSVIGKPLKPDYATSPSDFQKRYGVPPMTNQWYATQAAAQAAINNNFAPAGSLQANASQAGNALSGLSAIGDFASRLGQASTWLRVGEVVLGLVLIAIGVAKMTNAVPIATKIAGYVK